MAIPDALAKVDSLSEKALELLKEYCRFPSISAKNQAQSETAAFVRRILAGARAHLAPGGLLVCEIGDSRRALERAYPRVPFLWPETSAGAGQVFMLQREWISAGGRARTGAASRARPRRARARR